MKKINWLVVFGLGLVLLAASLYFLHFLIFHDVHHIFIYLLGDIAFIPLDVLVVTLIIHKLLTLREKKSMLQKMNMVIGAFFSEVGYALLELFTVYDINIETFRADMAVKPSWKVRDFKTLQKRIEHATFMIDSKRGNLNELKAFLSEKRQFLLSLLENPILLEHEHFTDLLWATFHLTEELIGRKKCDNLPQSDFDHLSGDMKRVYKILIMQWVMYMQHLHIAYPYLFSLAVRTNPFSETRDVVIH
jgi:hypothetical protein